MRRRRRTSVPSQFVFTILVVICIILLFASYSLDFKGGPVSTVANYLFVPMQKGMNYIGNHITVNSEEAKSREQLMKENRALTAQVDDLKNQISQMQLQQSQLEDLENLYELDKTYGTYEKTAAHVIACDSSNWFNSFTIDKGSDDGIKTDMNIIAGNGLVGIVTRVGKNYAVVDAIINDSTSVSATVSTTGDNCVITGSLKDMTQSNVIEMTSLEDPDRSVKEGDAVVTSNISSKYLPGILIGYVTSLKNNSNDLTRTGTVTPVADFKHIRNVLVITQLKETGAKETESNE